MQPPTLLSSKISEFLKKLALFNKTSTFFRNHFKESAGMSDKVRVLANTITDAFVSVAHPGPQHLVIDEAKNHTLAQRIMRDLADKHWRDLSLGLLRQHTETLFFLSPQAYHFYLPAYMLASVLYTKNAHEIPDGLVQSLAAPLYESGQKQRLLNISALLTAPQKTIVLDMLNYLNTEHRDQFPSGRVAFLLRMMWQPRRVTPSSSMH
jgi:hypothetical protein